jgi:hypothetical protein
MFNKLDNSFFSVVEESYENGAKASVSDFNRKNNNVDSANIAGME